MPWAMPPRLAFEFSLIVACRPNESFDKLLFSDGAIGVGSATGWGVETTGICCGDVGLLEE